MFNLAVEFAARKLKRSMTLEGADTSSSREKLKGFVGGNTCQ